MKQLISAALSVILTLAALPAFANAPEPTLDQTRDWVIATISASAGYTHDATAVTYKDVSMDGCQLRFTTLTSTPTGYTDTETSIVSLDLGHRKQSATGLRDLHRRSSDQPQQAKSLARARSPAPNPKRLHDNRLPRVR
jgi:hypothetical protein